MIITLIKKLYYLARSKKLRGIKIAKLHLNHRNIFKNCKIRRLIILYLGCVKNDKKRLRSRRNGGTRHSSWLRNLGDLHRQSFGEMFCSV